MAALEAHPLNARPKGARVVHGDRVEERAQMMLELNGLACEAREDGREWLELDGWQDLWHSAAAAQSAMNHALRDLHGAYVHRVAGALYLRVSGLAP